MKRETPIPKYKINAIKELAELIKSKKTILLASIKSIPGSQFQEIVKKIRNKAIVKVPKKSLILRAIDKSAEEVKEIREKIDESFAILFSDIDAFELAGELMKNQSPTKAKAGQEAPEDIEIPEGMTNLIPGPAVSELSALGLQIKIENGKINITAPKVVAKKGEKIKPAVADLLSKLDIKPFKIGFIPICAFDNEEKKLYSEIKVDREGTLKNLRVAYGKALPFAVEIGYPNSDTITFLIGKAEIHEKALENLKTPEKEPEKTEEKIEEKEKKKEEESKEESNQTSEDKSEEENK